MLDTLPTDQQVYRLAAVIVATAALVAYLRAPPWVWGPRATFWNLARRALVPLLDQFVDEHVDEATGGAIDYASYELHNSEFVGRVATSLGDLERELYADGFTRMPLAALKSLEDGRIERGSWARRESLLAREQTHVMLFDTPPGESGVDVYAHREPNAINPFTAWAHYKARGYDPAAGVEAVQQWLDESALAYKQSP
jgi:hypothetical protein